MDSYEEAFNMFMVLGECRQNFRNAANMFNERFPNQPRKSHMAFVRLKARFLRNGNVQVKRNKPAHVTTDENATNILAYVRFNPEASTREISRQSGVSRASILRILRKYKFHPYSISLHQDLYENDYIQRVNFCTWIRQQITLNPLFTSHLMFSDEASFTNTGQVNRHNMHYWSETNPHWMRTVPYQHPWTLNVWCGIVENHIIGLHFFEGRLTGQIYSHFLRNILPQLLEEVPLNVRGIMWMQHDGAPPHNALCARQVMDEMFPERWIGRGGLRNWPARSPDLTPLDFFLWGFIKGRVMSTAPTTSEDMKARICQACTQVTPEMLACVRENFFKRIIKCMEAEGHHFEHLNLPLD